MLFLCSGDITQHPCHHADDQWMWCSPEIKKALEIGYEIVKVHEVYNYESASDQFSSFVKYFMKLKQQCSGFPHWWKFE